MATLPAGIIAIVTTLADMAEQASEGTIPIAGLPDTTDVAAIALPGAGAIVGIAVTGKPASGDTVTIVPALCTSAAGANLTKVSGLSCQITNAAPQNAFAISKDTANAQFSAGAATPNNFLALRALTTNGGAYTTRDVTVTVFVQTSLENL